MKGVAIAVIEAIESGAVRVKDIAERTGQKRSTIWWRLHELKRMGAVRAYRLHGDGKGVHGRPQNRYALRTGTWHNQATPRW